MANVLKSISYAVEDEPIIHAAQKIAERERRSFSKIVILALEEYNKAHGKGNASFALETFAGGNIALPTPWGTLGTAELKPYSWKEDDDMILRLERTLAAIKNDRQAKRDEAMRSKGLRPKA